MASTFLGTSGNALNFLNPAGEQIQVAPDALNQSDLDAIFAQDMYKKAQAGQLGAYQTAGGNVYDPMGGGFQVSKELSPEFMQSISSVPGVVEGIPMFQQPYSSRELESMAEDKKLQDMKQQLEQFRQAGISNPALEQAIAAREQAAGVGGGDAGSMQIAGNQAQIPERADGGVFNTGSPVTGQQADILKSLAPYQKGYEMEMAGVRKEAEAGKRAGLEQQKALAEFLDPNSEYQRRQAMGMAEADQINARVKDMSNKYESMVNDYLQTSAVDPNRLWANTNTGGKIMAGISMLLGGLGAGLAGGPNQGLAMIEKMIDRDIDAQKSEIEKKKSGLGMQQNLVGMLRGQLQDNEASMMAAKRIALDNVEMQLKKTMAGLQGTQAEANGMKALGELQLKKAALDDQLKQKFAESAAMQSISSGGTITPQAALKLPKEVQDRMVKVGSDSMAMAISPQAAKDIQERLPDFDQSSKLASDLLGLVKEGGTSIPFTEKKAKAQSLSSALALKIKDMNKLGQLTEADLRLVEGIIGDPTSMFSAGNRTKLEQFIKNVEANKKKFLNQNTFGYRPELPTEKRSFKIPSQSR